MFFECDYEIDCCHNHNCENCDSYCMCGSCKYSEECDDKGSCYDYRD